MKKSELEVVANFLKKLKEKYDVGKPYKIVVELEGNAIVVYELSPVEWEGDYWNELERFEL